MNIIEIAREVADKDKDDPVRHGLITLTTEEMERFANAVIKAHEAKLQAQSEPVPKGVLLALSNAGLMLIKTQHGYEVRKLGKITAQGFMPTWEK